MAVESNGHHYWIVKGRVVSSRGAKSPWADWWHAGGKELGVQDSNDTATIDYSRNVPVRSDV